VVDDGRRPVHPEGTLAIRSEGAAARLHRHRLAAAHHGGDRADLASSSRALSLSALRMDGDRQSAVREAKVDTGEGNDLPRGEIVGETFGGEMSFRLFALLNVGGHCPSSVPGSKALEKCS
jgi:hypothetical protein